VARWLAQVDPIGRSMAVYGPLAAADKAVTLARVVLLTWVLSPAQFGAWGLGVMVFSVLAPVLVLGADEAVGRYLSYYQVRGRLREMFDRTSGGVAVVAVVLAGAAALCSGPIARALGTVPRVGADVPAAGMRAIVLLGVLNALLMGLFHVLQGCLRAMRTLRLLGVLNLGYTLAFTTLALGWGALRPTGRTVLWAHAAALAAFLAVGWLAARRLVAGPQDWPAEGSPDGGPAGGVMGKLIRFGSVAMLAGLAWQGGGHVTTWFIHRYHGSDVLGVYMPLRQICQPIWILSTIIWPVVFAYVAVRWESGRRDGALGLLNGAYKLTVLGLMTLSVLVLAAAPLWGRALGGGYRVDVPVVAGLLMFFQCSANLGMAAMAAKLNERPVAAVIIVAAGAAANVLLAAAWVPAGGDAAAGVAGGARAAGVGMLLACAAGSAYLAASRFRAHPAVYVLSVSPALLLLPVPLAAGAWAAVLAVAALTPWVLTARERQAVRESLRRAPSADS